MISASRADILSPEAQALIGDLNAELTLQYPEEEARHFRLDADEVAEGRGAFVIVRRDGTPIACGAVRRIDEATGELKRMFVRQEARGQGVGRILLDALEGEARKLGMTRLVLETGTRQKPAIALYERTGFTHIPPFGEYVKSPFSVCMAKDL